MQAYEHNIELNLLFLVIKLLNLEQITYTFDTKGFDYLTVMSNTYQFMIDHFLKSGDRKTIFVA